MKIMEWNGMKCVFRAWNSGILGIVFVWNYAWNSGNSVLFNFLEFWEFCLSSCFLLGILFAWNSCF
jgi:hypothetical protein